MFRMRFGFSADPRCLCDCFGFFDGLDTTPFVGRFSPIQVPESEPEFVGRTELGIAAAALMRDFEEAERAAFADCEGDCTALYAVSGQVVVGHGQLSVVLSAVMGEFDLDAVEHAPGRQGQHSVRG